MSSRTLMETSRRAVICTCGPSKTTGGGWHSRLRMCIPTPHSTTGAALARSEYPSRNYFTTPSTAPSTAPRANTNRFNEPTSNLRRKSSVHKHMAATIDECVEMSHLKHKITAVIPTSTAPVNCLMWSVFSLLLRTQVDDLLEHFCVCINGPDERTGDPTIATTKQRFLEELRDLEWCHPDRPNVRRPMPLTVIRVWSRVGHSEPMQMALPWVHTDAYLLLHDDVFIRNANWTRQVKDKFYGDDN